MKLYFLGLISLLMPLSASGMAPQPPKNTRKTLRESMHDCTRTNRIPKSSAQPSWYNPKSSEIESPSKNTQTGPPPSCLYHAMNQTRYDENYDEDLKQAIIAETPVSQGENHNNEDLKNYYQRYDDPDDNGSDLDDDLKDTFNLLKD